MKPAQSVPDQFMPRREALQRLAILLGGTLSLPVQAALRGETRSELPLQFSSGQQRLVAQLADVIIPATSTPGANDADVGQFIEYVIGHCTTASHQELFQHGLTQADVFSQATFKKTFSELNRPQQIEVVGQLAQREKPFFLNLRELTIVGYFTSEVGAAGALDYLAVPGRFQGDIPLVPGQKVWAI